MSASRQFHRAIGNGFSSAGTFTLDSSATFSANSGTINFNGSTATLSCGSQTFNRVTFTHTIGTKTVSTDCTLPMGSNPSANSGGSIDLQGTLSGSGTLTTSGLLTLGTSSSTSNNINGEDASGFGDGGGGAGYYGGNGGAGLYGGGGGGAAGYTTTNRVGGDGGGGVVVLSPDVGADSVKTSGTSYTVPAGVSSIKVWAIGAGGGGAGSTNNNSGAGGGGGAGGTVYQTFSVTPGDTITYSLGTAGSGGTDTNDGSDGGNTTVTVGATTITGDGGSGGTYNDGSNANGGSYSGGDGGYDGAPGFGASGNTGGGGGGGIGSTNVPPSLATDSVGSADGTPVNSPDTTASPVKLGSHAGDFTGSNDYLAIDSDLIDLTSDWSFETWLYLTTTSGTNPRIFGMVDNTHSLNLQVGYTSSGIPYIRVGNTLHSFTPTFSTGGWQHVVYKYDSGSYYLYINGTKYSVTGSSGPSANTSFAGIGAAGSSTYQITGYLDDAVLYDGALTDAEVTDRYNSGSGTEALSGGGWDVSDRAISQWHMNESAWDTSSSYSAGPTEGGTAGDTGGQGQDVSGLFVQCLRTGLRHDGAW